MRLDRLLILPLLLAALLLPQLSAAVASAVGGTWTVVLCTGDGLRTVVMGADGQPVEDTGHESPCALVQVADLSAPVPLLALGEAWAPLIWRAPVRTRLVDLAAREPNPARAPPSV